MAVRIQPVSAHPNPCPFLVSLLLGALVQAVLLCQDLGVSTSHSPETEIIPSEPHSPLSSINKDLASRLKEVKVLTEDAVCSGLHRAPD